jgi:multidrug efflux pump subunit AcrA (membrane-fusion protein)
MSDKQNSSIRRQLDLPALDAVLHGLIQAASQPAVTRDQLYATFHPRLIAATESLASAVFAKRTDSQFTMISQAGWKQFDSATLAEIKDSIKHQYHQTPVKPGNRISTFVATTPAVDGVEYLYVLVRKTDPDHLVEQLLADLVKEVAVQIETFELRRVSEHRPQVVQELTHLLQLTQNVAKSGGLSELAMQLVNDLARVTQADRVCFFSAAGRLLAVSGVSQISMKTRLARNLSRLAKIARQHRTSIESSEDQIALGNQRKPTAIKQWLSELESKRICIKPVEHQGRCCGVVSVEYFATEQPPGSWVDQGNRISRSLEFVAPIVSRAVQVNTIPGIRILDVFFNRIATKPVRLTFWLAGFLGLVWLGIYALFFVERSFEIHAEGVLQPCHARNVYAPLDGDIKSLLVSESGNVEFGQPLLVMESKTLSDQKIAIEGELAEVSQELQNIVIKDLQLDRKNEDDLNGIDQQTQAAAEVQRLRLRTENLQQRLKQLDAQLGALQLTAPIRGQITTTHLSQRLTSRPVNRGDLLMSIAELDGDWEIRLGVPDNRLNYIQSATDPQLRFRLAASSEQVFSGNIREYDFRADPEPESGTNRIQLLVDFDEAALKDQLRLGSRVVAKIDCGRRNNWFLLTYELKSKLNEWFFW